ncbi:hypothetical protein AYL99_12008 [Fonsecaea erecta]|uniref:Uncharacterized protein n=1 Tax=Fonsecaea erecta TaxID=1367422 RepID=A0A178Z1V9_9EURO|nr:hypothetical protein AYL99_12008 [Fonsecaea erecta]OAP53789.1 hypothetical protein AYL99_12008 [Fonsecaea erecta]
MYLGLAYSIEPGEVQDIQKYQDAGVKLIQAASQEGAREEDDSPAELDVAHELEKQGSPFCIEAIVDTYFQWRQAQDGYVAVDTWLDGRPDDINEVTITPKYNTEQLAEEIMPIQVPSVALVLESSFDIALEDAQTNPSDLDILEQLRRDAGFNKTVEAIPDVPASQPPTFEPASVNVGALDQNAPLEKDLGT